MSITQQQALPRYTEWAYLREHGQWSVGVPAWATDYAGQMNDGIAAHAVIEELRQYIEQGAGAGADVVMVPRKVLEACSESLGSFCSDHGWSQADMDNMDALDGFLAAQAGAQEPAKC